MSTASFFVLGGLCLLGLYTLGGARERRFLVRALAVALVLVMAALVWLVLSPKAVRKTETPLGPPAGQLK